MKGNKDISLYFIGFIFSNLISPNFQDFLSDLRTINFVYLNSTSILASHMKEIEYHLQITTYQFSF